MGERFEELRRLLAQATPPPWRHYRNKLRPNFGGIINEVQCRQKCPVVRWGGFDDSDRSEPKHSANAAFIAAARNQLADVLANLDAAEAEVAELKAKLEAPQKRPFSDKFAQEVIDRQVKLLDTQNERIQTAEAEVARLREALTDIGVYGCGMLNQPIAVNGPEEAWLRKRIAEYERRARAALSPKEGSEP